MELMERNVTIKASFYGVRCKQRGVKNQTRKQLVDFRFWSIKASFHIYKFVIAICNCPPLEIYKIERYIQFPVRIHMQLAWHSYIQIDKHLDIVRGFQAQEAAHINPAFEKGISGFDIVKDLETICNQRNLRRHNLPLWVALAAKLELSEAIDQLTRDFVEQGVFAAAVELGGGADRGTAEEARRRRRWRRQRRWRLERR